MHGLYAVIEFYPSQYGIDDVVHIYDGDERRYHAGWNCANQSSPWTWEQFLEASSKHKAVDKLFSETFSSEEKLQKAFLRQKQTCEGRYYIPLELHIVQQF